MGGLGSRPPRSPPFARNRRLPLQGPLVHVSALLALRGDLLPLPPVPYTPTARQSTTSNHTVGRVLNAAPRGLAKCAAQAHCQLVHIPPPRAQRRCGSQVCMPIARTVRAIVGK